MADKRKEKEKLVKAAVMKSKKVDALRHRLGRLDKQVSNVLAINIAGYNAI